MRNCIKFIFFHFIFIISCKQNYLNEKFCEALSGYIRETKIDSNSLIVSEFVALKAFRPKLEINIVDHDTIYLNEPPPIQAGFVIISKMDLALLAKNAVIDSNEIEYLFKQAQNVSKLKFICSNLKYRSISAHKLTNINSTADIDAFYNRLEQEYKVRSYIEFSQPLFSRDYQTVIFGSNMYCGSLCGSGELVVMKYIKGEWKIIFTKVTWIS